MSTIYQRGVATSGWRCLQCSADFIHGGTTHRRTFVRMVAHKILRHGRLPSPAPWLVTDYTTATRYLATYWRRLP